MKLWQHVKAIIWTLWTERKNILGLSWPLTTFLAKLIVNIFLFLVCLEFSMVIHEYGHYVEMKNKNIEIKEFSIGIGWPLIQYQTQDSLLLSWRAIPIAAYVEPTTKGNQQIEKLTKWDQTVIYTAGVRNNILFAIILLILLQATALLKLKTQTKTFARKLLLIPIKIILLYPLLFIDIFTFAKYNLCSKTLITIQANPPHHILKNLIILNIILGLANLFPLYPLDGGYIFLLVLTPLLAGHQLILGLFKIISWLMIIFVCFLGKIKTKLVEFKPIS